MTVKFYSTIPKFDFEKTQLYAVCNGIWFAINGPFMRRVLAQSEASLQLVDFDTLPCAFTHFDAASIERAAQRELSNAK